jgi:hypothetical protein
MLRLPRQAYKVLRSRSFGYPFGACPDGGDGETAVFTEVPSVVARTSAEAATTACRTGELAFNSFLADSSTWPSAHETSVDSLWLIVWAFSYAAR